MRAKATTWVWFAIPFLMVTAQMKATPPDSILLKIAQGDIANLPATVAVGLLDPDPLLDVAEYADGKVTVYRNLGNGTFSPVWERRVAGEVVKMEWHKTRVFSGGIPDISSWSDLHVFYEDGMSEVITHGEMMFAVLQTREGSFMSFSNPLDFREVWRSELQWQPSPQVVVGDFDNDGHMEMLYTFSEWPGYERELVVYKSVGNNSFVIDWDTVLTNINGPFLVTDIDGDGRKEIVFARPPRLVLLECIGPGQYQYYETNITYSDPLYAVVQADINHNGFKELCLTTSTLNPSPGTDATKIYVGHFLHKDTAASFISFYVEVATYYYYVFDLAVGQVDGVGNLEIVLGSGSPFTYLWHNGFNWGVRRTHVGLGAGLFYGRFVNLDADTTLEFFGGGVGPIGHGSCYALKYVSDTTWAVLWVDSSLRSTPQSVNSGLLDGEFVVAGANTWSRGDTLWSQMHVYQPSGVKVGVWHRDTTSAYDFHLVDIENNGETNLIFAISSNHAGNHLAVYKYYGPTGVEGHVENGAGGFTLYRNYPNPFNPSTTLRYDLPEESHVSLRVYDMLGREVGVLVEAVQSGGNHAAVLASSDLSSGVYFARFTATSVVGEFRFSRVTKLILVK